MSFDARLRTLELAGNVRVDAPPFHLRAQRIRLTRTSIGIEIEGLEGKGSLAFCPCLGTPLKVDFDKAIVAPPGDLILKSPTLKFYDVPILPLPWFWLRSDEKVGLLPPDIAYRAQDGVFVGAGVHLPWKSRGLKHAIDLRGGAYLFRGFVADARLRTPVSTTKIRYDRLPGASAPPLPLAPGETAVAEPSDDGLIVEARGATSAGELGVAWDVDVVRGRRGVVATTDLDTASKPWDRASAEAAIREGPLVVSSAMRVVTRRGGGVADADAAGPIATVRASGAASSAITYDVTIEGGALRVAGTAAAFEARQEPSVTPDTLSFARAEAGARAVTIAGPLEASLAIRGAGNVAVEARRDGNDRAASARARLGAPLARRFEATDPDTANDPLVHVIEPFAELAVLHAAGNGLLGLSPARSASAIDGTAPVVESGVSTSLGRWGSRDALQITTTGGAALGSRAVTSRVRPLGRARASASLGWVGATADVAWVIGEPRPSESANDASGGVAAAARARLGPPDGVRLLANVAARDGLDPVLARALVDAPLEPASGFLTRAGTTGGAGFVIPWSRVLTTSAGADADLTSVELVAARGTVEIRDRCGCLTLRVMGAHRLGRTGVDVWLALDFAADR
ncbi:MAG: hypothetical protein KF819_17035 [Labilithrix sp.]|nr:hypothetical protein [Labilithrix sp.]